MEETFKEYFSQEPEFKMTCATYSRDELDRMGTIKSIASDAWNHQQEKINQRDERIADMEADNKMWREYSQRDGRICKELEASLEKKSKEIGASEHRGNTVDYIYDKLENYSNQLCGLKPKCDELEAKVKQLESIDKERLEYMLKFETLWAKKYEEKAARTKRLVAVIEELRGYLPLFEFNKHAETIKEAKEISEGK